MPMIAADEAHEFLTRTLGRYRGYLRVLVRDEHEAEDLLQELGMRYLRQGPPPGTQAAEAWLRVAARNLAVDALRGRKRRAAREAAVAPSAPPPDPAEEAGRREMLGRVRACMDQLPDDLREWLYLNVAEGLPLSRLAEQFDVPRSTLALRVREALIRFSRCVEGAAP